MFLQQANQVPIRIKTMPVKANDCRTAPNWTSGHMNRAGIFLLLLSGAMMSMGLTWPWQETPQETNNKIQEANPDLPTRAQSKILEIDRIQKMDLKQRGQAAPAAQDLLQPKPEEFANMPKQLATSPNPRDIKAGRVPVTTNAAARVQEQALKKLPDTTALSDGVRGDVTRIAAANEESATVNIDTTAAGLAKALQKVPGDTPGAQNTNPEVPSVPSLPNLSSTEVVGKLNQIQRLNRLGQAAVPSQISGAGRLPDMGKIQTSSSLNKMGAAQAVATPTIPNFQGQINRLMQMHDQVRMQHKTQSAKLQRVVDLSRKHQKMLDELRQTEEGNGNVTVFDEEEILRQQEIRMKEAKEEYHVSAESLKGKPRQKKA